MTTTADDFIPFCRPTLETEEIDAVVATLRSGWITTGPRVAELEDAFRERLGMPQAVAMNSATAGLQLTFAAHDIGPGDEVITPSITWPSAVNMIELLGARPVFADVLPETLQIDPVDVAAKISARTRAVVPVHFAGQPADMTALEAAVEGTSAVIIEDAAHAAGTFHGRREIGSGPHTTIFSFHPIKNITTGEGGMVVTGDEALAERLRRLRFHGVSKDAWARYGRSGSPRYEVLEPGWKHNMLDLQAALGVQQMKKLDRFNAARAELAGLYTELLSDVPEVRPLARVPYEHRHAWHLFIVDLDLAALTIDRDGFFAAMADEGIGTGLHFSPVHLHAYYRERYEPKPGDLPHSEAAGESILSLPLYPLLEREQVVRVVDTIKRIVARHSARHSA